jgi:SAM-dependent methyltransferase
VFQNPALSLRGLDYYYDEAYDGEGEASTDVVFGGLGPVDRERVKTVAQFTKPTAWLDVGTGYGHFCAAAQRELPDTVFDGLDIGQTVEEGARRGWLDRAYQGLFPEMADGLPRSYDVVSMHHYLEHTRDPQRELEAAAKVLEPGGHLEIEVPDPADPWARWAGRFWLPWYQPQHQHLVPCENLIGALGEAGFEVVSAQRGQAHMRSLDIASTAWMAANDLAGLPEVRWRPASDAAHPLRRVAVLGLATPVLLAAGLAEMVRDEWILRGGNAKVGNTYRVVARRV